MEIKSNFCRGCGVTCAVDIAVDDGRTVSLQPIKDHPVYHGYACAKGRATVDFAYLPGRLLHSMKRQPDGSHKPIEKERVIAEVAATIQHTINQYGPRSVAMYSGTLGTINTTPWVFGEAFMEAIGSPMSFSSLQIDSPGKLLALASHGMWLAGHANLNQADAWLVIGSNPAVSMQGPANPAYVIHQAKKRGCRIYVIDPRRSEMARHADVFMQARPGTDAVILAGLIHIVIAENRQDQAFIDDNVRGFEALRKAVEAFTPEFVAERAGVKPEDLKAVARGFSSTRCGIAFAGVGPNMAMHGSVMEYLRTALMTVCGHWRRVGDDVSAQGVWVHLPPALAQATDPTPAFDPNQKMRIRNLTKTASGMPTSALAEEILLEGEGQVRVLIVNGANPMAAWPDQARTRKALEKLDLLVCIDPTMNDTAKQADYVIAPKVQYELINSGAFLEMAHLIYPVYHPLEPYGAYFDAIVPPPPGSDVIDDWEFFYGLAQHMNVDLRLKPIAYTFNPDEANKHAITLDMKSKPTNEQVWEMLTTGSPVALEQIKSYPEGHIFVRDEKVQPKTPGWTSKLDVGNDVMLADLRRAYIGSESPEVDNFAYRLIGRRIKDRFNSGWHEHKISTRKWAELPLFIHPEDMATHSLEEGDKVELRSRHGAINCVAVPDKRLLRGVICTTHSWPSTAIGDKEPVYTGMLIDNTVDYDPLSAIPRMGDIPVNIKRLSM